MLTKGVAQGYVFSMEAYCLQKASSAVSFGVRGDITEH